jgi:(p)ppGpp synthase/HD superfamily hydrolase
MNDLEKIQKAIKFAVKTHEVYPDKIQTRKGKKVSYITHPLTVGLILSRVGANDDLVCAGILHDTIEDSIDRKKVTFEMIKERFGSNVAELVSSVSETAKNVSWEEKKGKALEHIKEFSQDSLLLKSADVISNVSEIIDDYEKDGEGIFERFKAPKPKKENTTQNYINVMNTILSLWPENPLKERLVSLSNKLELIKK